jgi:hypothetical protein
LPTISRTTLVERDAISSRRFISRRLFSRSSLIQPPSVTLILCFLARSGISPRLSCTL